MQGLPIRGRRRDGNELHLIIATRYVSHLLTPVLCSVCLLSLRANVYKRVYGNLVLTAKVERLWLLGKIKHTFLRNILM